MDFTPQRPQRPAHGRVVDQQQTLACFKQAFYRPYITCRWDPRIIRAVMGESDARNATHVVEKHHVPDMCMFWLQDCLGGRLFDQGRLDPIHIRKHFQEGIVGVGMAFADDKYIDAHQFGCPPATSMN